MLQDERGIGRCTDTVGQRRIGIGLLEGVELPVRDVAQPGREPLADQGHHAPDAGQQNRLPLRQGGSRKRLDRQSINEFRHAAVGGPCRDEARRKLVDPPGARPRNAPWDLRRLTA